MASGKGNYLLPPAPVGPLHFGLTLPHGHLPEGWFQMFYQLDQHGHDISGCKLKLWIWSFIVGAKALARNHINHLI